MIRGRYKTMMLIYIVLHVFASCKDPFDPVLKRTDTNSLVVEGYIEGSAPTTFFISRSRALTIRDTAARKYEEHANVMIEDDHQNKYPLSELGAGYYSTIDTLNLSPNNQYRLHIYTNDNREYLSDFVPMKIAPPIEAINWELKDNGVQILLNTGDPANATRYYRWEYKETWEFHATYHTSWKAVITANPYTISIVPQTEDVFTCWRSNFSTSMLLGTSAKLSSDVISRFPMAYVPPHDIKMSVLYSIWVKQYALDLPNYNYFTAIRDNTERIGSVFDPQPNQTPGNVHCVTDPEEEVIGFVGAGVTSEKRIFIPNSALPSNWNIPPDCPIELVPDVLDSLEFYFDGGWSPITKLMSSSGEVRYSASYTECVDCTKSGTNVKPSFWP